MLTNIVFLGIIAALAIGAVLMDLSYFKGGYYE